MKKALQLVVGIALAAALLALSLKGVDLRSVGRLTLQANPALVAASILVGLFGHNLLRAWRWRVMLGPEKPRIGLYNLFSTTVIGYAASWALPFRVGEVLRPVLLAERERIRASSAMATVLLERLLDGLAVMALFAVCLASWSGREGVGDQGQLILSAARKVSLVLLSFTLIVFALLVVAIATRAHWKGRVERFADGTRSAIAAKLARAAIGWVEGGVILTRPAGLAGVAALSVAIWLVIGLANWLGLRSAGVGISFQEGFILLPAMVLGIGVPTPGGAGSFEYFVSQSLQHLFREPAATAMAGTIVLHVAVTIVPVVLMGLALAWRDGLTLARLRSALAAAAGGAGGPGAASSKPPQRPARPVGPGSVEEAAP